MLVLVIVSITSRVIVHLKWIFKAQKLTVHQGYRLSKLLFSLSKQLVLFLLLPLGLLVCSNCFSKIVELIPNMLKCKSVISMHLPTIKKRDAGANDKDVIKDEVMVGP